MAKYRFHTEIKLEDKKEFKFLQPFARDWYNINNKTSKYRLGKIYNATVKTNPKDKEKYCIVRYIDLPRISVYFIENF